jgi:hypothetical protein
LSLFVDEIGMEVSASPTVASQKRVRIVTRTAPLAVRVWTGRSALSAATTTSLPHIATAGARRTRVSEMRIAAPHHDERGNLD